MDSSLIQRIYGCFYRSIFSPWKHWKIDSKIFWSNISKQTLEKQYKPNLLGNLLVLVKMLITKKIYNVKSKGKKIAATCVAYYCFAAIVSKYILVKVFVACFNPITWKNWKEDILLKMQITRQKFSPFFNARDVGIDNRVLNG